MKKAQGLFADDFLVFDEAHEIIDVASEHLGISVSSWGLETQVRQLFNPKKGKGLIAKIAREPDLSILESVTLPSAIFSIPASRNSGENDRVGLVLLIYYPRDFPPFGRLLHLG